MKAICLGVGLALLLSISGCATTAPPNLLDELQNQAQIKDTAIPTHLTDLGILRYGEKILEAWGLRSHEASVFNTGAQLTLAALSTGALATAGAANVPPNASKGIVSAFNFILAALGIIKPAERNDARHEGAAMILRARGEFLKSLSAKKIYHVSNVRYTPQGAIYFDQIGAALEIVDRLTVGMAPRIEDLKRLEPVPIEKQPNPEPELPPVSKPVQ